MKKKLLIAFIAMSILFMSKTNLELEKEVNAQELSMASFNMEENIEKKLKASTKDAQSFNEISNNLPSTDTITEEKSNNIIKSILMIEEMPILENTNVYTITPDEITEKKEYNYDTEKNYNIEIESLNNSYNERIASEEKKYQEVIDMNEYYMKEHLDEEKEVYEENIYLIEEWYTENLIFLNESIDTENYNILLNKLDEEYSNRLKKLKKEYVELQEEIKSSANRLLTEEKEIYEENISLIDKWYEDTLNSLNEKYSNLKLTDDLEKACKK